MLTKIHVVYIFIVGLVGNFIEKLQLYVYVLRYFDVQKLNLKKMVASIYIYIKMTMIRNVIFKVQ